MLLWNIQNYAVMINPFVRDNDAGEPYFGSNNCRKNAAEIRLSVLTNLATNSCNDNKLATDFLWQNTIYNLPFFAEIKDAY